jgi:hypothetical protein
MTLNDCRTALQINEEIKQLKAVKKQNADRNSISTIGVDTGRGTETYSFSIPWSQIVTIIDNSLAKYSNELRSLGVELPEGI